MPLRLQFKGERARSLPQKAVILTGLTVATLAACWFIFFAPDPYRLHGSSGRKLAVTACSVVYVGRVAVTLVVFLKRRIPWWEAAFGGLLVSSVVLLLSYAGGASPAPLGWVDAVGAALYGMGSYLGTRSEQQRHAWRRQAENRGRIYTQGLFRYCRHPNYLGDLLLFSGFAVLSAHPSAPVVPLAMALNFLLFVIPAHDAYLAARYSADFRDYAGRTKKLIPFVY